MIITNIIAGKLGVKKGDKSTIVSDVFLASINSEQGDAGIKNLISQSGIMIYGLTIS